MTIIIMDILAFVLCFVITYNAFKNSWQSKILWLLASIIWALNIYLDFVFNAQQSLFSYVLIIGASLFYSMIILAILKVKHNET